MVTTLFLAIYVTISHFFVQPTDDTIVVGMSSGLISIRHRKVEDSEAATRKRQKHSRVSHRSYDRGNKVYTAQEVGFCIQDQPK